MPPREIRSEHKVRQSVDTHSRIKQRVRARRNSDGVKCASNKPGTTGFVLMTWNLVVEGLGGGANGSEMLAPIGGTNIRSHWDVSGRVPHDTRRVIHPTGSETRTVVGEGRKTFLQFGQICALAPADRWMESHPGNPESRIGSGERDRRKSLKAPLRATHAARHSGTT